MIFTGQSALHVAASQGHLACCESLIQYGLDILGQDNHKMTPIHLAGDKIVVFNFIRVYYQECVCDG